MRLGLVIVGVVILAVGATLFVTVVPHPPTHTVTNVTSTNFLASAPPRGGTVSKPGIVQSQPPGPYVLFWIANASVGLKFYDAAGCIFLPNGTCQGKPLVTWPDNASGLYSNASGLSCPCYAIPSNVHDYGYEVGINGYLVVTGTQQAPSLTEWSYAAVVFGSLILLVIGGLALFLGLFLRGHLFGREPPGGPGPEWVPRDPNEEYEDVAPPGPGVTGPRTDYWRGGAG